MITPESPGADVGTQPANFDELDMESVATMRPMSTQAI
jgi:serine/threonine-protein kinase PknG